MEQKQQKKRNLTTNRSFNELVKFYFHFKFSDFPHWLLFYACAFLDSLMVLVAYCSGDPDPSLNAELEASHNPTKKVYLTLVSILIVAFFSHFCEIKISKTFQCV